MRDGEKKNENIKMMLNGRQLLLAVLLCGCAQKDPATHSWDSGVQGVCVRKTAFL